MSQWPVHVEPLDRAILDLLCSLPTSWDDHDAEALTGAEQEAVRLMVQAGLIELRLLVQATMDGRDARHSRVLIGDVSSVPSGESRSAGTMTRSRDRARCGG